MLTLNSWAERGVSNTRVDTVFAAPWAAVYSEKQVPYSPMYKSHPSTRCTRNFDLISWYQVQY